MPSKPPSPWMLVGVGTVVAVLVAGGMLLGFFIDKRENTLPLFAFVGLAVGIFAACLYAYTQFRKFWS